ncbi:unnamed protein product, partial [Laminaria digitata]
GGGGSGAGRAPVADDTIGCAAFGERETRTNSNGSSSIASEDGPLEDSEGGGLNGVGGGAGCGAGASFGGSCTTATASTCSPADSTSVSGGGGGGGVSAGGGGGPFSFESSDVPRWRRAMEDDPFGALLGESEGGAGGGGLYSAGAGAAFSHSVGNSSSRGTVSPGLEVCGGGRGGITREGFCPWAEEAESALALRAAAAAAAASAAEGVEVGGRTEGDDGSGTGVGGDPDDDEEGARFPLVVGGAVLKVDWADPLRYHIHLNGGIKGPSAPPELGMMPDGRTASSRVGGATRVPAPAGMWVACAPRQGG